MENNQFLIVTSKKYLNPLPHRDTFSNRADPDQELTVVMDATTGTSHKPLELKKIRPIYTFTILEIHVFIFF